MQLWIKQNNRCPLCQQEWVVQRFGSWLIHCNLDFWLSIFFSWLDSNSFSVQFGSNNPIGNYSKPPPGGAVQVGKGEWGTLFGIVRVSINFMLYKLWPSESYWPWLFAIILVVRLYLQTQFLWGTIHYVSSLFCGPLQAKNVLESEFLSYVLSLSSLALPENWAAPVMELTFTIENEHIAYLNWMVAEKALL